jgi:phage-related baseplate assembly protein
MSQSDLDLAALRNRIATRWLELSGQPLTIGSLEWAYREVLVLIASWAKIDTENAINVAYDKYKTEVYKLPYGAGNKEAIIALSRAYTDVADVNVANTNTPMSIQVFLLAKTGTPSAGQIAGLEAYLNSPIVKNICDTYTVFAATQVTWNFNATITVSGNPIALQALATTAVSDYAVSKLKLGATIRPSDLTSAIRSIAGIDDVAISAPISNLITTANQFPKIGSVTIVTTII